MLVLLAVLLLAGCTRFTGGDEQGGGDPCPTPAQGNLLLTNPDWGYCVVYPEGYVVEGLAQATMIDRAPGRQGQEPKMPFVEIFVTDAEGKSAAELAEETVASVHESIPDFEIERTTLTVGGEEAVRLDVLPGMELNRQVLVVHDDKLYTLTFVPADPSSEWFVQMEQLYATVTNSMQFIDTTQAAQQ
jgi:hypothetical protein